MVICQELQHWLTRQDPRDENAARRIEDHIQTCKACKTLYKKDFSLDDFIRQGMQAVDPPSGLIMRARSRVESETRPRPWLFPGLSLLKTTFLQRPWKAAVPVLAMATLLLVLLNPFAGQLRTVDEVVNYSIANHLDADMQMAFRAGDINNVNQWFTRQLNYAVRIPNLNQLGVSLVGGRRCTLGKTDTALLFCHSKGKRASIFVIDQKDTDFKLEKERKYIVEDGDLKVTLWKQSGLLYALVI